MNTLQQEEELDMCASYLVQSLSSSSSSRLVPNQGVGWVLGVSKVPHLQRTSDTLTHISIPHDFLLFRFALAGNRLRSRDVVG